ncbi:exodeoxyribonuclease III [Dysgonomonas macrotermitis]|uniref:Exodeoxyribonuclease-3 n=1 Tax=Dysgonomonas macrotermitis TaxID=1346286 RepID=A0A1M4YPU2_9BACT|nr:exodeoxyribonuclease III [Dysgonomonas macrotermitis]SHF07780.1 exodeoxyribonuclease-3 [Dysgonomonas macrotermitis]
MKIISYNVNGIRSAASKGLHDWLEISQPDVACFQELKAQEDQIDTVSLNSIGYPYCYFHPAKKKGYSGVGLISKTQPDLVKIGMGIEKYDDEGRVIRADFGPLTIICVYMPSGTTGDARQAFKMEFLADFTVFISELRKERKEILICGDYNICHKAIDINNPEKHTTMSGFLPEEREWFDGFVATGMIDTFRVFDKSPERYTWWSFRARAKGKNLGWRIDYHLLSEEARHRLKSASIFREIEYSDHCPVRVELDMTL